MTTYVGAAGLATRYVGALGPNRYVGTADRAAWDALAGAPAPTLDLGTYNAGTGAIDGGNWDSLESSVQPGHTRFVVDPVFGAAAAADGYRFFGDKKPAGQTLSYNTDLEIAAPSWEATSTFANAEGVTINTRITIRHESDINTVVAEALDSFTVAVASAPTAVGDSFEVLSGATTTFDVLANDVDDEGLGLTIVSLGSTSGTGTPTISAGEISYTAGPSSESDSFTYTIEDASGDQATATVNVTVVGMTISAGTGGGDATLDGLSDDDATIVVDSGIDAYDGTYVVSTAAMAAGPVTGVDPLVLSGTVGSGVLSLGYGLHFTDPDKTGSPNGDGTTVLVLEALAGGSPIGTWTWGPVTQDVPSHDQDANGVPDQLRVTVTDGGGDQAVVTVDLAVPANQAPAISDQTITIRVTAAEEPANTAPTISDQTITLTVEPFVNTAPALSDQTITLIVEPSA